MDMRSRWPGLMLEPADRVDDDEDWGGGFCESALVLEGLIAMAEDPHTS